ncbi:preprotein translocase subunit SecE [Boudabousia tangfeifanii]|uniref:Protein translocase subunit SecE n=1 Tax=Boudabousia tangfeifanii TaxID=1912795 RepID=A0A1D9MIU7_9ACTO|nr:preprotein translocase subunit SecE [Boudabousia tangfeifanii]AOZ72206.1 preprotein translocase subunit SecE [Boudabousia tangfeifanii]
MDEALKSNEEEKLGFFGRIMLFIRQVILELKKVVYPTKDELWTYFLVVIFFVAVLMAFIGLVDLGMGWLSAKIFG